MLARFSASTGFSDIECLQKVGWFRLIEAALLGSCLFESRCDLPAEDALVQVGGSEGRWMEAGRDGSRVANAVVMELLNGLRLGCACGGGGHGGARTDGGRRNPVSRGHGRGQTDRGHVGRVAVPVATGLERMREDEFRRLVVTGSPERIGAARGGAPRWSRTCPNGWRGPKTGPSWSWAAPNG